MSHEGCRDKSRKAYVFSNQDIGFFMNIRQRYAPDQGGLLHKEVLHPIRALH